MNFGSTSGAQVKRSVVSKPPSFSHFTLPLCYTHSPSLLNLTFFFSFLPLQILPLTYLPIYIARFYLATIYLSLSSRLSFTSYMGLVQGFDPTPSRSQWWITLVQLYLVHLPAIVALSTWYLGLFCPTPLPSAFARFLFRRFFAVAFFSNCAVISPPLPDGTRYRWKSRSIAASRGLPTYSYRARSLAACTDSSCVPQSLERMSWVGRKRKTIRKKKNRSSSNKKLKTKNRLNFYLIVSYCPGYRRCIDPSRVYGRVAGGYNQHQ